MTDLALYLLQYGLAFVFVWTGVLILKDVPGWAGIIRSSWASRFIMGTPESSMRMTAIMDIVIGLWLVSGLWLWLAALVAGLHLITVLLVTGIMSPAYRDVGLLTACIALMLSTVPQGVVEWVTNLV